MISPSAYQCITIVSMTAQTIFEVCSVVVDLHEIPFAIEFNFSAQIFLRPTVFHALHHVGNIRRAYVVEQNDELR